MRKILFPLLSVILITGCSEKTSDDAFLSAPSHTYDWLMENAWQAFIESDFTQAIVLFQTAADRDATKAEPYLGLGWSYARSSDLDLEMSVSNFNMAVNFSLFDAENGDMLKNEAKAGLSVVAFAYGNYDEAIGYIQEVLAADGEFEFRYDTNVNAQTLSQMQYYSQFYLQNISDLFKDLIDSGIVFNTVQEITGPAIVSTLDNTQMDGVHSATLSELFTDLQVDCAYDPAESFADLGTDGCDDSFEDGAGGCLGSEDPGYVTGSDPNGDNYDEVTNPSGTQGNGAYDMGEQFEDGNGNGLWDDAEPFEDVNGNGSWDANNAYYKLLFVSSIQSCEDGIDYIIENVDEGLNTFTFQGNPVLTDGQLLTVTYTYTTNYGSFINELLGILASQ